MVSLLMMAMVANCSLKIRVRAKDKAVVSAVKVVVRDEDKDVARDGAAKVAVDLVAEAEDRPRCISLKSCA